MTVYKSAATKYAIPFVFILIAATIVSINEREIFNATICFILALIPIAFIGLSYKWRFVTADDYMQIDSIVLGKKIHWNEVIAAEDMKYDNGMYLLRVINKDQMFEIPVSMLKGQDIVNIANYVNQKTKQYRIPFNHDIPYFKSMYYQYKPNILSNIGYFSPPLHEKTKVWKYSVWIIFMLITAFISKRLEWVKSTDKDIIILVVLSFAMLVLGWLHLLFAQFPQNLRAIEHNQREQHDQMFVPTVTSAQPYRLPFALVSLILLAVLGWIYWYLTN
ncbi:hypothetical protein [Herpetosiphon giganteus]|uniref:hypothetical protein n=1 Tax=Herpetosiphon giganteus TaxID=2029754 RepID=UPI00195B5266|nr:hypothetical protein [Herpetosiphon giganteus]MBM7843088.1 NADH:ubiquinone oxidoreductase subunit 6 (subunit J) [Herpetosiphon giganteus]